MSQINPTFTGFILLNGQFVLPSFGHLSYPTLGEKGNPTSGSAQTAFIMNLMENASFKNKSPPKKHFLVEFWQIRDHFIIVMWHMYLLKSGPKIGLFLLTLTTFFGLHLDLTVVLKTAIYQNKWVRHKCHFRPQKSYSETTLQ